MFNWFTNFCLKWFTNFCLRCFPTSCLKCFGYREDRDDAYARDEENDDSIINTIRGAIGSMVPYAFAHALELIQLNPKCVTVGIVEDLGALVSNGVLVEPCMKALIEDCGPFGHREALALIRENPPLLTCDLLMLVQEESRRQFVAMLMIACPHHPPRQCKKTNPPFLSRMP